jgi:HlyD family secretion protein
MSDALVPATTQPVSFILRWKLALAAGFVVAAVFAGIVWQRGDTVTTGAVVSESVDRGPITAVVTATGVVNPVKTVIVGTYVSGPIRAIDVDFNSPVRQGQRMAKIDPGQFQMKVRQFEAGLASARARVAKSRADLDRKQRDLERSIELSRRDLLPQSTLDATRSDVEQARAQVALDEAGVRQAEAGVEEARINLGYTDILSPVDGVVVSRNVDVGQTVAASFQTPTLFQVAEDLTKMQVNTAVSESDIGTLGEGQDAEFNVDAHPGRLFRGRVLQVRNAPTTVSNVVTYDVVIQVDNADLALKPGMTATVSIVTARRDDVLRVPLRALRFRPAATDGTNEAGAKDATDAAAESDGVWVKDPSGSLRRVALQAGLRDESHVEVIDGALAPGDAVIVSYLRPASSEEPAKTSPFMPSRRR